MVAPLILQKVAAMSFMSVETILGAVLSGSITISVARSFVLKTLRQLDRMTDKISEIKAELSGISVRLHQHEKDRQLILKHDRQLAVLESETRRFKKVK